MDSSRRGDIKLPQEDTQKAPDPGQWFKKRGKATSSSAVGADGTTLDTGKRSLTDPKDKPRSSGAGFLSKGIDEFLNLGKSNTSESRKADASQPRKPSPLPRLRTPDISASPTTGAAGYDKTEPTQIGPQERKRPEILAAMPVQEEVPGLGRIEQTGPRDNQASHGEISQQLSTLAVGWKKATDKVNELKQELDSNQQELKNVQRKLEKDPEYDHFKKQDAYLQKQYDKVKQLEHVYTTVPQGEHEREKEQREGNALFELESGFSIEGGTAARDTFKRVKEEIKSEINAHREKWEKRKNGVKTPFTLIERGKTIRTQLAAEMANSHSVLTEYQNVLKQYHAVSPSYTSSREVLSPMRQQEIPVKLHPDEFHTLALVQAHQESRNNALSQKEANVAADKKAYDDITQRFHKTKADQEKALQKFQTQEQALSKEDAFANVGKKVGTATQEYRTTVTSLTTTWGLRFGFAPGQSLQQAIETGEVPRRMRGQENWLKRERENLQVEIRSREARESFLKEHMRENPEVVAPIDVSFGGVSSLEGKSTLYVPESSQRPQGEISISEEAAARERVIQPGELKALDARIADLYASLNELRQDAIAIDKQIKALPDAMAKRLRNSEERLNAEEMHISIYDKIADDRDTFLGKEISIQEEISRLAAARWKRPHYMTDEEYNSIEVREQEQYEELHIVQASLADIPTRWSSWKHNDANDQYNLGNAKLRNNSTLEDEMRNVFRVVEDRRKILSSRRKNFRQDIERENEREREREEAILQEQRRKNESTSKETFEQYQKALGERDQLLMIQKIQDRQQRGVTATDGQEGAATTALITTAEQKRQLDQQQVEVTNRLADIDETLSLLKNDEVLRDKKRASFVDQKVTLNAQREAIGTFERQYAELSKKLSANQVSINEYDTQIKNLQDDSSGRSANTLKKKELTALVVKANEELNQLIQELKGLNAEWNKQFKPRDAVQLNDKLLEDTRASLDREYIGLDQKINLLDRRAENNRQEISDLEKAQKEAQIDKRRIGAELAVVSAEYNIAEMRTRRMAKPQGTQEASEASILSPARGENTADKQVVSRERPSIETGQTINLEEFSRLATGQEERAQEIEKLVPTGEDFVNLTRAREDLQNWEQEERRSEQQVQELATREKELLARKSDLDDKGSNWETRMQAFEARKDEDRTVTEYDSLINEGEQWRESNLRYPQDKRALERDWVQPLATQKKVRGERAFASKNYEDAKKVVSEKLVQTEREIQQQFQSFETKKSSLTSLKSELDKDWTYLDNWTQKHSEFLNEAYSPGIIHDAAWEDDFKQRWVAWKNPERGPQEAPYSLEAGQKPQTILNQDASLLKARKEEWSSKDNVYRQVSEKLEQERTALAARQSELERAQALVKAQEGDILAAELRRLEMRQEQLDISWQGIERDQAHLTKRINDWNEFAKEGKSKFINDKTWQADFAQRWVTWKNAERAPQEQRYTLEPELSAIRDAVVAENVSLRDRSAKWQTRLNIYQKNTQQLKQERTALMARQSELEHAQAFVKAHEGDILERPVQSSHVEDPGQPESLTISRETQGSEAEKGAQEAEYVRGLQARLAILRKELSPEYRSLMQKEEEIQQQRRMAADSEKTLDSELEKIRSAQFHLDMRYLTYNELLVEYRKIISNKPEVYDLQEKFDKLNRQWEERKIGSPISLDKMQIQAKGKGKGKIPRELTPAMIFENDLAEENDLLNLEDSDLRERSLSIGQRYRAWQEDQKSLIEQQTTNIASVPNEGHRAKLQEYSDVLTTLRERGASLEMQTKDENGAKVADVPPSPINVPGSEASRSSILENPQPHAPRRDADTERPAIPEAEMATPTEKLKALKEQIQALPDEVQKLAMHEEELQQRGQQLDRRKRELDSAEERVKAYLQNLDQERRISNDIQSKFEDHLGLEKVKGQIVQDGRDKITDEWVKTFGEKDRELFQKNFSQETSKDRLFSDTFDLLMQRKSEIVREHQLAAKEWQSQYDKLERRMARNAKKREPVQASYKDILDEHFRLLTTLRGHNLLGQPASGVLNQLSIGAVETLKRSIGTIRRQQAERPPDTDPEMHL